MEKNYFALDEYDDTTVLIDGANFFLSNMSFEIKVDYNRLRNYFSERSKLVRIIYYSILKIEEDEEDTTTEKYNPMKPVLDFLTYNGFQTVIKQKFVPPQSQQTTRKFFVGNMNAEISADLILHAQFSKHIVLFGGSNDWAYAVEKAKTRFGTRFTACSLVETGGNSNFGFGDDLRRTVDVAVDIGNPEIHRLFSRT